MSALVGGMVLWFVAIYCVCMSTSPEGEEDEITIPIAKVKR